MTEGMSTNAHTLHSQLRARKTGLMLASISYGWLAADPQQNRSIGLEARRLSSSIKQVKSKTD